RRPASPARCRSGRAPAPRGGARRCAAARRPRTCARQEGSFASTSKAELLAQLDHGKAGARRLAALVLALGLGARQALRLVLDGEDAEADGDAVFEGEVLQPARALLADIVVMRRLAADDAAERDIAVETPLGALAPALDGDADRCRNLEGAGDCE